MKGKQSMKKVTKHVTIKDEWIAKIMDLYPDMTFETIVQQKYNYKTTFKKLYYDYLDRFNTLSEAQTLLADLEAKDLMKYKVFKGKASCTASHFMTAVYIDRDSVPRRPFIDRLKKLMNEIQLERELEDDTEEL